MVIVKGIYIANRPGTFVSSSVEEAELKFGGLEGDRHFGLTMKSDVRQPMYPRGTEIMNRRQISILAEEEMRQVAEALGIEELRPEWIGANLLLDGLPELTALPPNARLLLPSGAGLICEGENEPCVDAGMEVQKHHPERAKLGPKFVKAAFRRRGIVCTVERPGLIRQGDEVRVVYP